jgi:hypothetical protein
VAFAFVASCSGIHHGHADVLPQPLPGKILSFVAMEGPCSSEGCYFRYRIRITNTTDRDANVQRCFVTHPRLTYLFIEGPAGFRVPSHATRATTAKYVVSLPKSAAAALRANVASCEGLDWHGDPPA